MTDMALVVERYGRLRRALAYVVWKNRPFVWIARLFAISPYERISLQLQPDMQLTLLAASGAPVHEYARQVNESLGFILPGRV